jgi:hypothetical protein
MDRCIWAILGAVLITALAWPLVQKKYLIGADLEKNVLSVAANDGWKIKFLQTETDTQKIIESYRKDGLLCIIIINTLLFVFFIINAEFFTRTQLVIPFLQAVATSVSSLELSQVASISSSTEKVLLVTSLTVGLCAGYISNEEEKKQIKNYWPLNIISLLVGLVLLKLNFSAAFAFYAIYFCTVYKINPIAKGASLISNWMKYAAFLPLIYVTYLQTGSKMKNMELWEYYPILIWTLFIIIHICEYSVKKQISWQSGLLNSLIFAIIIYCSFNYNVSIGWFSLLVISFSVVHRMKYISNNPFSKCAIYLIILLASLIIHIMNLQSIKTISSQQAAIADYIREWLKKDRGYVFELSSKSHLVNDKENINIKKLSSISEIFELGKLKQIESNENTLRFYLQDLARKKDCQNTILLNSFFDITNINHVKIKNKLPKGIYNFSGSFELKFCGLSLIDIKVNTYEENIIKLTRTVHVVGKRILSKIIKIDSLFESIFDMELGQTRKYAQNRSELNHRLVSQFTYDPTDKKCKFINLLNPNRSNEKKAGYVPFADPVSLLPIIMTDFNNGTLQNIYAYSETGKINLIRVIIKECVWDAKSKKNIFVILLEPLLDEAMTCLDFNKVIDFGKCIQVAAGFEDTEIKSIKGMIKGLSFSIIQKEANGNQ